MNININIPFEELKQVILKLTIAESQEIMIELEKKFKTKTINKSSEIERRKQVLLKGPTISKSEEKTIIEARKRINSWKLKV